MHIGEVLVKTHEKGRYVPITEHPYYMALNEWNPTIYREYVHKSAYQSSKPSGTWRGFVELTRNVYAHGLTFSEDDRIEIVNTDKGWKCRHGKHRVCIIMFLYGPSVRLQIKRGVVVGMEPRPTVSPMRHACVLAGLLKQMVGMCG
jgi:hypothetical protein